MEYKTPKEFLEEKLSARFKPEKAAGINITAQLTLTGPNGGDWVVIVKNQTLKVAKGLHPSPELTLKIADQDFMDLVNGKLSTSKAFLTGKIHLNGNFAIALKLKDAGFLDFGT
jgi:putative sterol carrier protein